MKSKAEKNQNTIEKDYSKIMKDFQKQELPFSQTPHWTNPNDFITKFSLYQENPNSIASTETSVFLG